MKTHFRANGIFRRITGDKKGNFTVMAALLLPVGLGMAGLAIDTTQMITTKAALQAAADSAALAAATALVNGEKTIPQAQQLALDFVKGQMSNQVSQDEKTKTPFDFSTCTTVTINQAATIGTGKKFDVKVNTCKPVKFTAFSALIGQTATTVKVSASAQSSTESKNALSMYLVLDRSGSMDEYTNTVKSTYTCRVGKRTTTCTSYYTKIEALRTAATDLMNQLGTSDPNTMFVRTGAVSYNSAMQTPTAIAWGQTAVKNYISLLTATGGTDSGLAFKTGYQALMASTENTQHAAKNGQVPSKYIVFMTDGDNNYTSADTETKIWCDAARANGVEVFSVAFMAPDRGKALLSYCATTASHYFAAEDADQLNAAFKYIGERTTRQNSLLTQ